ncbi:hypothetical protein HZB02_07055 [Candidatus Woesearchaeota archaeon]|nr:hypothetical protein [Candidatus Woesearchaeota archaeon]
MNRESKLCLVILSLLFTLLFSTVGSIFLLAAHYYVHEYLGHVLFGYLTNIPFGNIPIFHIGHWEKIFGLPIPQNTQFDNVIISLSGPVMMILFAVIISFILYQYLGTQISSRKIGIALLCFFILSISGQTIFGDVLFGGTDDWINGSEPILRSNSHPYLQWYIHQSALISLGCSLLVLSYFFFPLINQKVELIIVNHSPK